jgi:hypothetical protein
MTDIVERIEEALRHDTFRDTDAPPLLRGAVAEIKRLLRERERVTEPMTKEKRAEVSSAPVFADKTRIWPVSYEKSDEKRVLYDTNHDAVPEARAQNPTTGSCPAREGCCTGDTPALSESEREAIEQMLDEASGKACVESWVPDILLNLLERMA